MPDAGRGPGIGASTGPVSGPGAGARQSSDEAVPLVRALAARGWTVAVAESLTGGAVASSLVDVPGASLVLRGAVVAYATDLKASLLDVDPRLLADRGAVDPAVAEAMARGVRGRLGADVGLATTGVAGPAPQDGHPPGEVYVAVATPHDVRVERLVLAGDRRTVRDAARRAVLASAVDLVRGPPVDGNTGLQGDVG